MIERQIKIRQVGQAKQEECRVHYDALGGLKDTPQGVGGPKSGEKDYPVSALVDDVTSFMQRLVRLWRI